MTGAVPVMTGSGATTPTRRQIEIARAWGVNVILGFPSYLRHLAIEAKEELGIDPHGLGIRSLGSHLGQDDRALQRRPHRRDGPFVPAAGARVHAQARGG